MAPKARLLLVLISVIYVASANYKYSSWYDLPRCAQNGLSELVKGSSDFGCTGNSIPCACKSDYGSENPTNLSVFDIAFSKWIEDEPWIASNHTGGCWGHPDNQDVDLKELQSYEHDIFCFLNNSTCPHTGCDKNTPPQSSASSSTTITATTSTFTKTSTSSSSAGSTAPSSSMSHSTSASSPGTSPSLSTNTMLTQSVKLTTVPVVVTASTTVGMPATSNAPASTTTGAHSSGPTSASLSGDLSFKSTLALLIVLGVTVILFG